MRSYRKTKSVQAVDDCVPRPYSQAELIEACLSPAHWKTAEQIYDDVNRTNQRFSLARVKQHLEWHVKNSKRLEVKAE